MTKKLSKGIALLTILATILTGCASSAEESSGSNGKNNEKEVKIAVVGPMTGNGAEYGKAFKDGAELAVDKFNNSGKSDIKVSLVFGDDKNNPKEAANIAQKNIF
jgi:branched-chain amino acid transport system substrate-binding protein